MSKGSVSNLTGSYHSNTDLSRFDFRFTGLKGGDAGHGGYLELSIDTSGGMMQLEAGVDGAPPTRVEKLVIRFAGDFEMMSALNALEFITGQVRKSVGGAPMSGPGV